MISSNLASHSGSIPSLSDADMTSCLELPVGQVKSWKMFFDLDQLFVASATILQVNVHGSESLCRADNVALIIAMHRSDDLGEECQGRTHKLCTFQSYASQTCSYDCQCDGNCVSLSIVLLPKSAETVDYDICEITLSRE